MQAFILSEVGGTPAIGNFDEPTKVAEGQEIFEVLAAGVNPVDRYLVQNDSPLPRVVGLEAIGLRADGTRAYVAQTVAPYGSFAEKAVGVSEQMFTLPDELAVGSALALGVSGLAAWLPLEWKANLQPGESVLILGATGVQGQIAVQAAKLLGAGHVTAAGRDREVLESLLDKGADAIAVLDGYMAAALKEAAPEKGYEVVIDSIFGQPFTALMDSGTLHANSRVAVLGGSAGQEVTLGFRQLQGTQGATVAGYSTFYVPVEEKRKAYLTMAQHVIDGKLQIDVQSFSLGQAAEAWQAQAQGPHRKIVITLG